MAWPWNSELRLDLRIGGCMAELHGAGFARRLKASASAAGTGATAISAALSALRLVDEGALLPSDARLIVADEYVFYALLDARSTVQQALADATEQFHHALAREDLVVQVAPLPAGHGWLAAAVPEAHLHAWADALADAGVRLQHLHPALVVDLARIARQVREDEAVVALLRDHGATFVRIGTGVPTALAWEPFDTEDRGALDLRLQAFIANTSPAAAHQAQRGRTGSTGEAIYLYDTGKVLRRYGSSIDDHPADSEPPADALQPSAFEAAFAADVFDTRFAAMQDGGRARLGPHAPRPTTHGTLTAARAAAALPTGTAAPMGTAGPRRPGAAEGPGLRPGGAGRAGAFATAASTPADEGDAAGGARLKALAEKLRAALQRSRAGRAERRRHAANARAAAGLDFSPTGSVLPDEWQDTAQFDPDQAKHDQASTSQHASQHASQAGGGWVQAMPVDEALDEDAMLDLAFLPAAALGAGAAAPTAYRFAAPTAVPNAVPVVTRGTAPAASWPPGATPGRPVPQAADAPRAPGGGTAANPWRRAGAGSTPEGLTASAGRPGATGAFGLPGSAGASVAPGPSSPFSRPGPGARRGRPVLTVVGGSDLPAPPGDRSSLEAPRHGSWPADAEPPVLERVVLPAGERRRP